MTGIDVVTLITNIGFPAGFAIVLLWMMSTKMEMLLDLVKTLVAKMDVLIKDSSVITEVRQADEVIKLLKDVKDKIDRIEYLLTKRIE